jgi:hypothetical protein
MSRAEAAEFELVLFPFAPPPLSLRVIHRPQNQQIKRAKEGERVRSFMNVKFDFCIEAARVGALREGKNKLLL